jgi:hypothetical protein
MYNITEQGDTMRLEPVHDSNYYHDNLSEETRHGQIRRQISDDLFYDLLTYFCHAPPVPKLRRVIDEYFSEYEREERHKRIPLSVFMEGYDSATLTS